MQLLDHIAQEIVEKTNEILEHQISITDNQGIIIGSTDKSRIGIFSQAALEVLKRNDVVECHYEIPKELPGVSSPIKFNHQVIGVLGIVGNPKEVEKYVQLVKNQVEMLCQEAFRKEMIELKEKIVEMFIHQLIYYKDQDNNDYELMEQYAKLLEIDIQKDKVCLIIDINRSLPNKLFRKKNDEYLGTFQYFQKELVSFLHLIFHENKEDMIASLDFERFIVIKSLPYKETYTSLVESLEEKLKKLNALVHMKYHAFISISIGNQQQGIKGMVESYQNALQALNLGIYRNDDCRIHIYNEREALLWLLPKKLKATYQKKLLNSISALIEHNNFEILASTFIQFCKCNMNLSEAARKLFIHRNTMIYRLEKIKEITGLNTNSFEDCMLLYTAILSLEDWKHRSNNFIGI